MLKEQEFLGITFSDGTMNDVRTRLHEMVDANTYSYVVTPNVDNVVSFHDASYPKTQEIYSKAGLTLCDSKVLSILGRFLGVRMRPCTGSDLTRSLIENPLYDGCRMAVLGPPREDFDVLRQKYPASDIRYLPAPARLTIGTPEWDETVDGAMSAEWDLLFVCITFPKQENIVYDLLTRGCSRGVAFCVGASIDFLTGKQVRAPRIYTTLGLEWLHRLLSNPKRMWKRYLVKGPKIFPIMFRYAWKKFRNKA
ncbi:WecB/TagA/CpsF family glycosyltransferase [uncultured Abyssibacter sp.]|uniref:WecB/TagA/CpsF family glycosyltransferase n=1 Tax=uncultured Abyssibacter sp. TaxID=2320202 RepID=UPI0032B2DAFE